MTPQDFVDQTQGISALVRGSFLAAWPLWLESDLYAAVGTIGVLTAVPFAGLWAYKWMHQERGELTKTAVQQLAVLFLVLLLIGSPGAQRGNLLSEVTQGVHRVGYEVSDFVLREVNELAGGDDLVTEVGAQNAARLVVDLAIERCGVLADPEVRQNCFDSAEVQMRSIIEPWGQPPNFRPWSTELVNELFQRLQMARAETNTGTDFFGVVGTELSGVVTDSATSAGLGLLLVFGTGYLLAIEVAALGTALIGPLAVGISLIPLEGRPLLSWASGFVALGIARLMYSLVIATTAFVLYNGAGGLLGAAVFPIVAGIFAPAISFAVAVGGGLSLLNGLVGLSVLLVR